MVFLTIIFLTMFFLAIFCIAMILPAISDSPLKLIQNRCWIKMPAGFAIRTAAQHAAPLACRRDCFPLDSDHNLPPY